MNVRENLKAYLDGELSPAEVELVEQALQADPELQQELDLMRVLGIEISRIAKQPRVDGVQATLDRVSRPRRRWVRWAPQIALAGVLLVAFVLAPKFNGPRFGGVAETAAPAASTLKSEGTEFDSAEAGKRPLPGGEARQRQGRGGAGSESPTGGLGSKASAQEPETQDSYYVSVPEAKSPVTNPDSDFESQRQIIRDATMGLKVENVVKTTSQIQMMVKGVRGFVTSSSTSRGAKNRPYANMTLRVPEKQFDSMIERLRELGEVLSDNITGDDVTTQIADMNARIKTLRSEEETLRQILKGTRKIGEVLEVRDRLTSVRQEIESYTAQAKSMKNLAALSTISVSLEQRYPEDEKPKPEGNWSEETWENAKLGLAAVGRFLAQVAIFLFVYSPIWIPVVLIAWWISRRAKAA